MPPTSPSRDHWKRLSLLAFAAAVPLAASGQALTPPSTATAPPPLVRISPSPVELRPVAPTTPPSQAPTPAPTPAPAPSAPAASQNSIDQLTQSNHDLLELLKKQQGVLEDMQFDRRLQSRQIENLEVRLTETLEQNALLQAKVSKLQAQLEAPPPTPLPIPPPPTNAPPAAPTPAPEPASYLPPAPPESAPGFKSWHRITTLSGTENDMTDPVHIEGITWRVVWHNQDKDGETYKNTSALFINAFAKGDTIPQKVCSKLGSGGDITELSGPGDFVVKVEASGGKWELAIEDFR